MKQSGFPAKISVPFAANAGSTYIRTVPGTTTDAGAASFSAGFPPATFQPTTTGGSPVDGRDMNGILNAISGLLQYYSAGVIPQFDSAFASSVGGYPISAIVADPTTTGAFWVSTTDANTTTPGASGASWKSLFAGCLPSQSTLGQSKQVYYTPTPSSSATTTHNSSLTFTAPCDGVLMAAANFNVSNIQPSQCQATLTVNGNTLWSDTTLFPMSGSGTASVTEGTTVTINSSYSLPPATSTFAAVGQTVSYIFVPVAQP